MKKEFEKLAKELGYQFNDLDLLKNAMTHRSIQDQNNERLEFLGDSILNMIIAEALYYQFPKAKEGPLSRLRATLVKAEALTELAKHFNLSNYLRLGVGELKSGGAYRESILADSMEAIIGAIFLDTDFETCKQIILNWYDDQLKTISLETNLKDPKTRLQEYLQANKYPLPSYTITAVEGESHAQTFTIECKVEGLELKAVGIGKSRQKAEQEAATQFLGALHEN